MTRSPELLLLEVGVIKGFGDLHARNVNFGVCGNDKLLVSPAQRNSVQSQGACSAQQGGGKVISEKAKKITTEAYNKLSLPVTSRRPLDSCFRNTTRWGKK